MFRGSERSDNPSSTGRDSEVVDPPLWILSEVNGRSEYEINPLPRSRKAKSFRNALITTAK